MAVIAWFFWQMEYHLQRELIYSKMRQDASALSARLTQAHMHGVELDFKKLEVSEGFHFGLYDAKKKALITAIEHPVDFVKNMYQSQAHLGVIDSSVLGHYGVDYVVVEEDMFSQMIVSFTRKVVLVFLVFFVLIALIGYWLAKLFIKPIYQERQKLDMFIKDSTHELNTPITALLMSTSSPNLTSEKNIQRIRLSAKRVSELYEDLTYLFLREQEDIVIKEPLSLDSVIKEQIEYLHPFADKKSLCIDVELAPFEVYMDRESAVRLVNNLLSNAIKYSHIGGEIEVRLIKGQLVVKDSGIGIDAEKLKDIFQRFYRATEHGGGFGIGLDMVQTIAKRFDIKIGVTSSLGKGTTFRLDFPVDAKR